MKKSLLIMPLAAICLSGCGATQLQRAMDCNRCAVQRSTEAINRNVEALDKVTENLKEMQG